MKRPWIVVVAVAAALAIVPVASGLVAGSQPRNAQERLDWMTPELADRLEAGERVPFEEIPGFPGSDSPYADAQIPYTRIRPGSPLGVSQLACTANFVFESGDRLGIGTAGHCTQVGSQEQVLVADPDSQTIGLLDFGETIMSTGNGGIGNDFALIEIDAQHHDLVHPAIAEIGGPCGLRATTGVGDPIQFYGHGVGVGAGGQPRTGAVIDQGDGWINYARLPAGSGGDSGSPVRYVVDGADTDLAAAAINTHGLGQLGWGTTTPQIMELIDQADIGSWSLVSSPNCETLP